MHLLDSFPILLVDDELRDETAAGRATRELVDHCVPMARRWSPPIVDDAEQIVRSTSTLSCLLIDWGTHHVPTIHDGGSTVVLEATARHDRAYGGPHRARARA